MQQHFDYLVIGGGVAGTTAAETVRANDAAGTICIVNDEPHPLYSRVMLSKPEWFLGKISFDHIWLKTLAWYTEKRITYLGGVRAVKLLPDKKQVHLSNGLELEYGKLLLALGTSVRRWSIPGADKKGIYYLRTLDDGQAVVEAVKTKKHPVTVGGGFISFEMDDLFRLANLPVTHLLRESYYWEPLIDEASGHMIEDALTKAGVTLKKNVEAKAVLGDESVEELELSNGDRIPCDMAMVGIGAAPVLDWLKDSGLDMQRGIRANKYLETNLPDVWAAGDAAEYEDVLLEESIELGNWVNATEQGRTVGANMAGTKKEFVFVSFYTTQGMGISIAFVGDVRVLPDRTIVKRGSPESGSYARIIVAHDEVEGATMINRTGDLTKLAKLIRTNMKVNDKLEALADPNTDLKTLLSE
jgi:NAD(P)H-nitrite reductase large subunit